MRYEYESEEDYEDEVYEDETEVTFCSLLRYFFFRYIFSFIFILLAIAVISPLVNYYFEIPWGFCLAIPAGLYMLWVIWYFIYSAYKEGIF